MVERQQMAPVVIARKIIFITCPVYCKTYTIIKIKYCDKLISFTPTRFTKYYILTRHIYYIDENHLISTECKIIMLF